MGHGALGGPQNNEALVKLRPVLSMFNFSCKLLILILAPGSEIRSSGYTYLNSFTSLERFSLLTQRKKLDFNFNFKVSLFSLENLGPGCHRFSCRTHVMDFTILLHLLE